ncbi:MAG TPA: hypothetical protein VLK25_07940 [Allosphingosinicella sp.]|nr:hypothetical protein [Allosphingosinicella sp.]
MNRDTSDLEAGFKGTGIVAVAGVIFIVSTLALLGIAAFKLFYAYGVERWQDVGPELVLCGMAAFTALVGVSLLRSGGLAATQPNRVINDAEWDAIRDQVKAGSEEPVTQYIRLTSLTGFTGTFTKLGLSGLPLATIGLTMFFSLLFFQSSEFLDLAKLTLGAFIGSFVQKQVGNQGSSSVKLPTGETVKISRSEPAY